MRSAASPSSAASPFGMLPTGGATILTWPRLEARGTPDVVGATREAPTPQSTTSMGTQTSTQSGPRPAQTRLRHRVCVRPLATCR
eukprot:2942360-Prymnesium_polylepis.1